MKIRTGRALDAGFSSIAGISAIPDLSNRSQVQKSALAQSSLVNADHDGLGKNVLPSFALDIAACRIFPHREPID
jgi:hypothetical protein